jgi:uncharacterized protein (TIGR02453 family)
MMQPAKFTGFTPAAIQFFSDLEANNYKPWFDANKVVYEQEIVQPFKALVTALTPAMYAIDSRFELRPHRVLSRIYRDIRFSPDKTPYKTCMWITFQRPVANWQNYPGYFMELSASGYIYGMGLYAAQKQVMEDFRTKVAYEQDHFHAITQDLVGSKGFSIEGEQYKRPLKNDLSEYFQPWIQRKSFWLKKGRPIGNEVFSEKFFQLLEADFTAMKDLYEFLSDM